MLYKWAYGRKLVDRKPDALPNFFYFAAKWSTKLKKHMDFMNILLISSGKIPELIGRVWWGLGLLQRCPSTSRQVYGQALRAASSVHHFLDTAWPLLPQGRKPPSAEIVNSVLKEGSLTEHYSGFLAKDRRGCALTAQPSSTAYFFQFLLWFALWLWPFLFWACPAEWAVTLGVSVQWPQGPSSTLGTRGASRNTLIWTGMETCHSCTCICNIPKRLRFLPFVESSSSDL